MYFSCIRNYQPTLFHTESIIAFWRAFLIQNIYWHDLRKLWNKHNISLIGGSVRHFARAWSRTLASSHTNTHTHTDTHTHTSFGRVASHSRHNRCWLPQALIIPSPDADRLDACFFVFSHLIWLEAVITMSPSPFKMIKPPLTSVTYGALNV